MSRFLFFFNLRKSALSADHLLGSVFVVYLQMTQIFADSNGGAIRINPDRERMGKLNAIDDVGKGRFGRVLRGVRRLLGVGECPQNGGWVKNVWQWG